VKLQNSPSGTYTNFSQAVFVTPGSSAVAQPVKISLAKAPTGMTVSWPSQIGVNYHVIASSSLTSSNWTQLSGNVVGTGLTNSWTDTSAAGSAGRFYRVVTP